MNDKAETAAGGGEVIIPKINLSNTPLNPGYRKDGLFDLPTNLKKRLRRQYEFRSNPTDDQLWTKIRNVVNILEDYNKDHEECRDVVLGAPPLLITPLQHRLVDTGYIVHYFAVQKNWNDGKSEYLHFGTREMLRLK